jgi:hypothetical protein
MKLPAVSKLILVVAGLLAIGYTAACVHLFRQQTRMIFFPSPIVETTPADFGLPYQDVWLLVAADSTERLHGWWIPATTRSIGVLLYLHGNGVNVGANVEHASRFHQLGFSVLLIDYRGYGQSAGNFPTEAQVYEDAQAAWNYLTQVQRVPPAQIFLYGHSLGGAIAIDLAARHPDAAGLIVQGTFTSMRDMVNRTRHLKVFPIDLLLTQRFDSLSKVRSLHMPVLFIHGSADQDVPANMSETLYAAAPDPRQLWIVPGAGHNDVATIAGSEYLRVVRQFVDRASR